MQSVAEQPFMRSLAGLALLVCGGCGPYPGSGSGAPGGAYAAPGGAAGKAAERKVPVSATVPGGAAWLRVESPNGALTLTAGGEQVTGEARVSASGPYPEETLRDWAAKVKVGV